MPNNSAQNAADAVIKIEEAIVEIAKAMQALKETRMKRDTIVLLLHDACGVGKRQINQVLDALDRLELRHLKPTPAHMQRVVAEVAGMPRRRR